MIRETPLEQSVLVTDTGRAPVQVSIRACALPTAIAIEVEASHDA